MSRWVVMVLWTVGASTGVVVRPVVLVGVVGLRMCVLRRCLWGCLSMTGCWWLVVGAARVCSGVWRRGPVALLGRLGKKWRPTKVVARARRVVVALVARSTVRVVALVRWVWAALAVSLTSRAVVVAAAITVAVAVALAALPVVRVVAAAPRWCLRGVA